MYVSLRAASFSGEAVSRLCGSLHLQKLALSKTEGTLIRSELITALNPVTQVNKKAG